MRLSGERTVEALTADLQQIVAHYRAELAKARAAADATGEGAQLFEDLMNAALDDLAALRGDTHG